MQFPRFPGMVAHRTPQEIGLFVATMQKAGLDPVAIAAVIELESAHTWSPSVKGPAGTFSDPPGYPIGLIQFAPSTARALGTTTEALASMSFGEQLPYVVKYYQKYGQNSLNRPVDYYLAGWGSGVGSDDSHVLARQGDMLYEHNRGLDRNGDGVITTGDLEDWISSIISNAQSNGTITPQVVAAGVGIEWLLWAAVAFFILKRKRIAHG